MSPITAIGSASLAVIPTFPNLKANLENGTGKALTTAGVSGGSKFGDAAGKSAGSRFGSVFKTAAKASLIGLGALGVGAIKLAGDSISAASDLEESTNKVAQVFGKGADEVFRFSEKAADALGQTNQQARDAAATFGILGKGAGFADQKNAKFATRMSKLASDLASFSNTSPDEAIDALGAALRGESEPIRKYGVLLDEATLKAEAMSLGILKPVKDEAKIKSYQARILEGQQKYNEAVAEFGPKSIEAIKAQAVLGTAQAGLQKATEGSIPPLTQQQKVLAAQSSIFKQTEDAQGDFARTSDGLANQQRRLTARFEDAKAKLGKGLLPIMTSAADFLLDKGIPAFEDFSDWFNKKGIPAIKDAHDEMKPLLKAVKNLGGFIEDLPAPAKIAGIATLIGGITYGKLRGGQSGVLGTAGKVLGVTKPVPVFVTNAGALGGGPGGGSRIPPAIIPTGEALTKGAKFGSRLRGIAPVLPAAGAWGNDQLPPLMDEKDVRTWERANSQAVIFNDATKKLPNQIDQGNTSAKNLLDTLLAVGKSDPKVTVSAPGFDALFDKTARYGSMLDGLNRTVVTNFVRNVTRNNDTGEGGGGTVPGRSPQPRTGGVDVIINGDVRPNDSREFLSYLQRHARGSALDGVRSIP